MKNALAILVSVVASMSAASEDIADQYPQSELYSKPVEVIPHVFSAIGATAPPTYENSGHNNNLSFVVTDEGVVVVNGGASARLAAALHEEIKAVTDQPVKLVVNENGQGHAMLGNSYWADLVWISSPMKRRPKKSNTTVISFYKVCSDIIAIRPKGHALFPPTSAFLTATPMNSAGDV